MEITNCTWEFAFQCPRHWNGLHETDDPGVRMCESCLEKVHLCCTEAEVEERSRRGECVALGFSRGPHLLGKVLPRT
jgi:hypothetical protein